MTTVNAKQKFKMLDLFYIWIIQPNLTIAPSSFYFKADRDYSAQFDLPL